MFELIDAETGQVLVPKVDVAPAFSVRGARGLLGCARIDEHAGLLLSDPLRCIHTIGMRFAIDIVFLDADLRVARVAERVPPGRLRWCRTGRHQLEVSAGTAAARGLERGRRVAVRARRDDDGGRIAPESPHALHGAWSPAHPPASIGCRGVWGVPSVPPPTGCGGS